MPYALFQIRPFLSWFAHHASLASLEPQLDFLHTYYPEVDVPRELIIDNLLEFLFGFYGTADMKTELTMFPEVGLASFPFWELELLYHVFYHLLWF